MDEVRTRYLRDKVMTASPAQRVVMIYDRLALDLARAREAADLPSAGPHLGHAASVVAELLSSLDVTAGGPAAGLADIYGFLLGQFTAIRTSGEVARIDTLIPIVSDLRDAFAQVAAQTASTAATASSAASAATAASMFGGPAGTLANPAGATRPAAQAWVG